MSGAHPAAAASTGASGGPPGPARVRFEPGHDGIGVVSMEDEEGRNAMSAAFVEELLAALRAAEAWRDLTVLVLVGLPDIFSSGANLDMLRALVGGSVLPTDLVLTKAVLDLPVPVIAAMEGHAVGGGLALGLAADLTLIARESRYGATFMDMGFTPGMGMTRLLEEVVSPALAREMLFSGESKKGASFEGRSGFNAILPRAEVRPRAMTLAARIAEKPRASLEMLKRATSLPRRRAFEETLTIESLMHRVSFAGPQVLARIESNHDQ